MAFPTGWLGYDELTPPNPGSPLTDFTFIISLASLSGQWYANVARDGGDIRVTDESNAVLTADLISFDFAGKTGLIAVKFTKTTSPQKLRVWCGKSGESFPSGGTGAYATHCKAFYAAGGGEDRTGNGNDLTPIGGPLLGDQPGPINGSSATALDGTQYWDGSTTIPSAVTFLCMFKPNTVSITHGLVATSNSGNNVDYFSLEGPVGVLKKLQIVSSSSGGTERGDSASGIVANSWQHMAGSSTSTNSRIAYLNGVAGTPNTNSTTPSNPNRISVGARFGSSVHDIANGTFSLVFIHDTVLVAHWITYHNAMLNGLASQGDFYSFGGWRDGRFVPMHDLPFGTMPDAASHNQASITDFFQNQKGELDLPYGGFLFNDSIKTLNVNGRQNWGGKIQGSGGQTFPLNELQYTPAAGSGQIGGSATRLVWGGNTEEPDLDDGAFIIIDTCEFELEGIVIQGQWSNGSKKE